MSDPTDEDLGTPVSELRELRIEESAGFLHRLRSRIDRRLTAAQILDFGLPAMGKALIEYLTMFFALFGAQGPKSEENDDE